MNPHLRRAACFGLLMAAWVAAQAADPPGLQVGPLRQVSGQSPFADCTADGLPPQSGTVYLNSEVEPWIDVNPLNPLHLVATWQQDRWSNGGARGLVAGVSLDGGESWQPMPVPGLSRCSQGVHRRASDPWLSFAADGTLHHISLSFTPGRSQPSAMLASRSLDGGLTWDEPQRLIQDVLPFFNDKEVILADPVNAGHVYAAWGRLNFSRFRGQAYFSRSVDGGLTWSPGVNLHDPGRFRQVLGVQLLVHPDGTVLMFFTEIFNVSGQLVTLLSFKRSQDQGATWQPRPPGAFRPLQMNLLSARDPDMGLSVRDGALLVDMAVDPESGRLYAVWQDGSSTGSQWPVIFFSASGDGGDSWSLPVRINRTPQGGPTLNRQAFLPSVHVAGNGAVGVSYYDFRHNDSGPEALADHWFIWCHPEAVDCTRGSRWNPEVRISQDSFDMLMTPFANGLFLGDYVGLSATEDDFLLLYSQPHDTDLASIFFRRLALVDVVEPRGAGFWSHQLRSAVEERGRGQETPERLRDYLADIHALHDLFDEVSSLQSLAQVLNPPRPAKMRARAAREVMALLLNVASGRLTPFTPAMGTADVAATATALVAVVADPAADGEALEVARDEAADLNDGILRP